MDESSGMAGEAAIVCSRQPWIPSWPQKPYNRSADVGDGGSSYAISRLGESIVLSLSLSLALLYAHT